MAVEILRGPDQAATRTSAGEAEDDDGGDEDDDGSSAMTATIAIRQAAFRARLYRLCRSGTA